MKASLRSRHEPRWVSNGVIIAAMPLSLCVLSIVQARTCSPSFGPGKTEDELPACTKNHSVPGFVFSNRGFSGNLHDYTNMLFPLFLCTHKFNSDVKFLLSDLKPWWVAKFKPLFRQLSNYDVVDVNNDLQVHCFPHIVVGSDFHKDMGIIPSKAAGHVFVVDFKRTLRNAFGLERAAVSRGGATGNRKPRLLIISRNSSRRFLNDWKMGAAAAEMGFEVRIAEPDQHTDMATFTRLVNSADAMLVIDGARTKYGGVRINT